MDFLIESIANVSWQNVVMWFIGALLIFLAIKFDMEPSLLLPMGFGAILVNIPLSNVVNDGETAGIIDWMFEIGIEASEAMPILLFIGIGAMIDFGPLLSNPKLFLLGGAAQFGIFMTLLLATLFGFGLNDAASIAIIGAADGPTAIVVAQALASKYLGPITIVAYSYMALVPIIQPAVVKLMTTKKERLIRMDYNHGGRGSDRAQIAGAGRLPDVRQPVARVRRFEIDVRNGSEHTRQSDHAAFGLDDRVADEGRSLPAA